MNIRVHIERLVLDGLDPGLGGGQAVQGAVEAELSRLLAWRGLARGASAGGAVPSVAGPAIQLAGGSDSARLGRKIAASIYGGIGR